MCKNRFLPQKGHYRKLRVFQLAEVIFDITNIFTAKFLDRYDRTVDQMNQAARSGKQNIAEGSINGSTSKELEIKLTNVARGSLQELLLDYEDFLRRNGLVQWTKEDPRTIQTRKIAQYNLDPQYFRNAVNERCAETVANIAITLIHQADVMLYRLIERQKADFSKYGGAKEQMYQHRKEQLRNK